MKLIYYIVFLLGLAVVPEISKQRLAVREVVTKAATGDAKALYDLAMLHDMGYDSIPVDSARSTALYRLAAERGYGPAQNYLGFRYFNGEAVRQDVDSALFWMAKAAAGGDAKAANNLGYLLAHSDKVTRDYPQAIYWLSKAADAGLPAGMSQLADLYRQGLGCSPDTMRAEQLYTRAIQAGLHDAELKLIAMKGHEWRALPADSALSLGKYHYTHGAPLAAVTLFEQIINPGPLPASASASLPAASLPPSPFSNSASLPAASLPSSPFSNSASLPAASLPPSPFNSCLSSGGAPLPASASASFPSSSSNSGQSSDGESDDAVAEALALLGDAYSRGIGVAYDHDNSVRLYKEAALRGNPSAQFVIAELLDIFPDAITFDNPEQNNASYWYDRAAAHGITDAATATTRLLN